jgi:dTDP-4-amino-4,6-dideoxygalactose transaminase
VLRRIRFSRKSPAFASNLLPWPTKFLFEYGRCLLVDPDAFGADRETVRLALEAQNIEARPVWKPMHLQPVFRNGTHPSRAVGGAVSESLFDQGLCLPSGAAMTPADRDRIVSIIRRCRR